MKKYIAKAMAACSAPVEVNNPMDSNHIIKLQLKPWIANVVRYKYSLLPNFGEETICHIFGMAHFPFRIH